MTPFTEDSRVKIPAILHFTRLGYSYKTALAYYNVHHLTAWFQKQGIVPKFYFIVDRIDLLIQAKWMAEIFAEKFARRSAPAPVTVEEYLAESQNEQPA